MSVIYAVSVQGVPVLKRLLKRDRTLEKRWLTSKERAWLARKKSADPCVRLSARLAAKKALFSALRKIGCPPELFAPGAVEVVNLRDGKPVLRPKARSLKNFLKLNVSDVFLSLSHTPSAGCAAVALRMKAA